MVLTLGRYGTTHSEVQHHQLRRMAQKGKDGEDDEMALMQLLREDLNRTFDHSFRKQCQQAEN